ncbi:hypothetical protein [Emticicia sp. W12TSBA100-4]|uniref:hypothetical protein n=1 Tax=Emticicia sp. W12TSBA100-4 TaxID=3160965 RepID=UPI0033056DCE
MNLINEIYRRNKLLAHLGTANIIATIVLGIYAFFNETTVLGINSMIKPIKFTLSIWIYSWTMALLLYYVNDQKQVRKYSRIAIIIYAFEELAITSQAFRGQLSHFNRTDLYSGVLYALMGVFIFTITILTLRIAWIFIRQKTYTISVPLALSIKIGLVLFVVFSLFGGYVSQLNGHTVGAKDGGVGLPLLNWSTVYGDLRVSHFFGIHALQIIPIFGYWVSSKYKAPTANTAIWGFSFIYFAYVCFTMIQALMGMPFLRVS